MEEKKDKPKSKKEEKKKGGELRKTTFSGLFRGVFFPLGIFVVVFLDDAMMDRVSNKEPSTAALNCPCDV